MTDAASDTRDAAAPRLFGLLDAVVIVVVLLSGAAALPWVQAGHPSTVVVIRDSRVVAEYPLSSSVDTDIDGAVGHVHLRVDSGAAWLSRSSCPRQICVGTGRISHVGQQIVCVPNRIVIEVRSPSDKESLDALTR